MNHPFSHIDTIQYDFHMHSSFSEDSQTPAEEMVLSSIEKGMKQICFTEHVDFDWPQGQGTFLVDEDAYFCALTWLREKYGNQIQICSGAELGMQAHLSGKLQRFALYRPFDFLIASQHLVDGADPYYEQFWEGKDPEETICRYFRQVLENIRSMKEYDTLGHLDYICRYVPDPSFRFHWKDYQQFIDPILLHLICNDKCLEVNSGGLRKNQCQPNPCEGILRRYHELGGELLTVGSDAHCPEDIASGFSTVRTILLDIGFKSICTFHSSEKGTRIRLAHPL